MWGFTNQPYSAQSGQQTGGEQSASQGTSEQPYVVATSATPIQTNHDAPPPYLPHHPQPGELNTPNHYATVPPGWTTAIDSTDGRIYYLEVATGRTSWTHPNAITTDSAGPGRTLNPLHPRSWNPFRRNSQNNSNPRGQNQHQPMTDPLGNPLDTPLNARNRPDTNQCYAFTSFVLCPPIGLIAMYHSFFCDRAWNQGRYSDAVVHAREAPKYAWFGCFVGAIFWIWFFFFRQESKVDWFEGWDWNFGD